jgi:hypothetical protein
MRLTRVGGAIDRRTGPCFPHSLTFVDHCHERILHSDWRNSSLAAFAGPCRLRRTGGSACPAVPGIHRRLCCRNGVARHRLWRLLAKSTCFRAHVDTARCRTSHWPRHRICWACVGWPARWGLCRRSPAFQGVGGCGLAVGRCTGRVLERGSLKETFLPSNLDLWITRFGDRVCNALAGFAAGRSLNTTEEPCQSTRSRINTPKKPSAAINVHFRMTSPQRR